MCNTFGLLAFFACKPPSVHHKGESSVQTDIRLSVIQVAHRLNLTPERIRQLANAGKIPYERTTLGRLFRPEDVEAFVQERAQATKNLTQKQAKAPEPPAQERTEAQKQTTSQVVETLRRFMAEASLNEGGEKKPGSREKVPV
jgi:excisionase family DNA binding protein